MLHHKYSNVVGLCGVLVAIGVALFAFVNATHSATTAPTPPPLPAALRTTPPPAPWTHVPPTISARDGGQAISPSLTNRGRG
jgi:hypothetical protein